jgi:predicted ATPase
MFKLIEIDFQNHPFFNNLKINFVGDGEEHGPNYTTLIIGPNGTGKSQILLATIAIFNSLHNAFKVERVRYKFDYYYKIRYLNNGREHNVAYDENGLFFDNNDHRYGRIDLDLPNKVLVSAFSFNDKYPLRENRGKIINENYYYLGLKSTTNNIFIYNPPKEAINNLYTAILNQKDILPLKDAFVTLDLKPELRLIYKPGKYFKFLQNNEFWDNIRLSTSQFSNSFSKFVEQKKRRRSDPELKRLGGEKLERLLEDEQRLRMLLDYLRANIRLITDLQNKEIALRPYLDFENETSFAEFTDHVRPFQLLSDLELISFERFEVKKLNANFSFDDASSGEFHILFTYLNILSLIEDNSLILLDEPEISLHPNWQIKYMDIFNKIFRRFPGVHFIIASHSHFLVSDLKSENSHILAVDIDAQGQVYLTPTIKNTYGWSAEQILLDVFKVATTRNYFITKTITDALKELGKENVNYDLVKEKLEQVIFLDSSEFKEHDPLKEVFIELKKLYSEI